MIGGQKHRLCMTRALITPADYLVANRDIAYSLSDCCYDTSEVAALPRWECGWPAVREALRPLRIRDASPGLMAAATTSMTT